MVEKDALSGVLGPVCKAFDIGITANKGYSSSSTMYEIGKRIREKAMEEKKITILYLGDHDPSGIDMTRDVEDRLLMYSGLDEVQERIQREIFEVVRLAMNWDQIQLLNPPENPAKETDARFSSYRRRFGDSSWELDAIEPSKLASLVQDAVLERRDEELWDKAQEKEQTMRNQLLSFVKKYNQK